MDKQEYKIRNDEIKSLIKQREFKQAVEIADTIDWTKVQSVMTLCSISDLYKVNRRYPEAKALLEQAYDRNPNGRQIVYSLCELCIRMGDIVAAIDYYNQYKHQWPMDNGKLILQYKIYETQDVSIEERIAVLEELKKRDYIPKWGYELANLYHRMGLATKCVEECDELIVWFGDGPYVKKAMELKMLHQQLTENQMDIYQSMLPPGQQAPVMTHSQAMPVMPATTNEDDIMVKTMDMGQYNTINLQRELAESMKDVLVADNGFAPLVETIEPSPREQLTQELAVQDVMEQLSKPLEPEVASKTSSITQSLTSPMMQNTVQMQDTGEMEELFFDDGNRSTEEMKLSALKEIYPQLTTPQETHEQHIPRSIDNDGKFEAEPEIPQYDPVRELELTMVYDSPMVPEDVLSTVVPENTKEEVIEEPVVNEEPTVDTANMGSTRVFTKKDLEEINSAIAKDVSIPREDIGDRDKEELMRLIDEKVQEALANAFSEERIQASTQAHMVTSQTAASQIANSVMDSMLSQEYDGQISLALKSEMPVEKQITGQMNIDDLLGEWENTKKHSQDKIISDTSQMMLEKTGPLFTEFEAKARDSILEQLEKEASLESVKEEQGEELVEESTDDAVEEIADEPVEDSEEVETEVMDEIESEDEIENESDDENENESDDEDEDESDDEDEDESDDEDEDESDDEDEDESNDEDEDESDGEDEDESDGEDEDESSEESGTIDRSMTEDELALFGQFAQTRRARQKLLWALDQVSLASYTGNIYVTGDTPDESLELAKNVVRYIQSTDHNFSGKIAKVTGVSLNNKSVSIMVDKLANGGLIIEKASGMSAETTKNLIKALNQQNKGIVVVLQDGKKSMRKMLEHFDGMKQIFNVHIEVEELSDDALVAYGKKYAEHLEYSIDDMGILALHTRIDAMQTSDHVVTVSDVRDIVDEAIANANRKSFKHFTDVLLSKRYDDEDMIILRERDFTE